MQDNHRTTRRSPTIAAVLGLALPVLLAAGPARAIDAQLQQAIERGKENFLHNTFGGTGRVCDSCHLGGGTQPGRRPDGQAMPSLTNAAAVFPRLSKDDRQVITLPDQVRRCVAGAVQGSPPAYGSDELNTLVVYVTSLSQGKTIDLGAAPR